MDTQILKNKLHDNILNLVEDELYNRLQSTNKQTGGKCTKVLVYDASNKLMPGKFEMVQNSATISPVDFVKTARERQRMFIREKNLKSL